MLFCQTSERNVIFLTASLACGCYCSGYLEQELTSLKDLVSQANLLTLISDIIRNDNCFPFSGHSTWSYQHYCVHCRYV